MVYDIQVAGVLLLCCVAGALTRYENMHFYRIGDTGSPPEAKNYILLYCWGNFNFPDPLLKVCIRTQNVKFTKYKRGELRQMITVVERDV